MMNVRKFYALLMMVAGLGMSTAQGMFLVPLLGLGYNGYKFGSLCYQQKNNSDIRARFAPVKAGLNDSFANGKTTSRGDAILWKQKLNDLQEDYPHLLKNDQSYIQFRAKYNEFAGVHISQTTSAVDASKKSTTTTEANEKANAFIKKKEDNAYNRWWSLAYRSALCCACAGLTIFAVKESRR